MTFQLECLERHFASRVKKIYNSGNLLILKETPKIMENKDDGIQITKLYDGKIEVKFYGPVADKPNRHMYYVGGKRKSGVTGFINIKDKSRPLGIWQQQMTADFLLGLIERGIKIDEDKAVEACIQHELFKEQAADIGKEIHEWCEKFIRHELKEEGFEKLPAIPDFPEAVTGVNSFMEWLKQHKVKFVSTERLIYSKKHDYVGTMDFEAIIDGKHCLGDFKSSNALYNGVRMQTAAYAMADMEERGKKFKGYDGRWAVRLSKYSEKEYLKKEQRKQQIKDAIARIQGKEASHFMKPYQIFEAQFLDNDDGMMKKDFAAFVNCMELSEWDKETDSFNRGGSLE